MNKIVRLLSALEPANPPELRFLDSATISEIVTFTEISDLFYSSKTNNSANSESISNLITDLETLFNYHIAGMLWRSWSRLILSEFSILPWAL
jgi:hypothetical protein